jgi:hypothetical protein
MPGLGSKPVHLVLKLQFPAFQFGNPQITASRPFNFFLDHPLESFVLCCELIDLGRLRHAILRWVLDNACSVTEPQQGVYTPKASLCKDFGAFAGLSNLQEIPG